MSLQLLTAALEATALPVCTRKKTEGLLEMMRLCVIDPVKRETSARRAAAELEMRLSIAIFFKNELTATLAAVSATDGTAVNGSAPPRARPRAATAPAVRRARAEREVELALASYQAGTELLISQEGVRGTGRDAHAVRDACTRCDALSIPIFTLLEEDHGPEAKLTALTRLLRRAAELRFARICEWMDAPTSDIAERIRRGDDIDLTGTRERVMMASRDAARRP